MSERTRAEVLKELTAAEQPYELVPGSVFGRECLRFKNAPPTLRELFSESRSDVEFIIYEDQRLTFDQAYIEASKIAMILVNDYGIAPGDRVAISMRNYPEWILAFMATTSIGGIAVAMNALWQPEEMAYGLTDSGAKILFADEERLARFAQIATPPNVDLIAVRTSAYANAPELATLIEQLEQSGQTIEMPSQCAQPEDDATLLYTSGSTGHPKGVASCHVNIVSALMSWELDMHSAVALMDEPPEAPAHPPASLMAVPLFHATGSHAVYLASYRHQRKLV